jgi:putative nucleotidyltransferase with HDIG domain
VSARYELTDEVATVEWMHEEVAMRGQLPLLEAESVVRSLAVAMHGDQEMLLPLLSLREFDEYTTTHSLNVSVLTMALAEAMGLGARDVRAFGVAGLLHDLGKTRIPLEILNKPGKLTDEERAVMQSHTAEGARLILISDRELDLAAAVAYEHHIMLNGGGYPHRQIERKCHCASALVHVCDVYDALRTHRPYRAAWEPDAVLKYIEDGAGTDFDPEIARVFVDLMRRMENRIEHSTLADVRGGVQEAVPVASP